MTVRHQLLKTMSVICMLAVLTGCGGKIKKIQPPPETALPVTTVVMLPTTTTTTATTTVTTTTVETTRTTTVQTTSSDDGTLKGFIRKHNLKLSDYPTKLLDLLDRNPETKDFVFNYPLKKDKPVEYSLEEYTESETVPLLMQWDERWGYDDYGGELMGLSGCGPTALSMVSLYLLHDAQYTPTYIAEYSVSNGYRVAGSGTSWTLMTKAAKKFGLKVKELSLDERTLLKHLEDGKPIICVMGPGAFTDTGHFIVLTGTVDGKLRLNDPNSISNSERLWEFEEISGQIKNLWVYSV